MFLICHVILPDHVFQEPYDLIGIPQGKLSSL